MRLASPRKRDARRFPRRFSDTFDTLDLEALRDAARHATRRDVERAIASGATVSDDLLPALFSPAASTMLETLAQRSAALTERRFGRTIQLYAPMYLSNECVNKCTYCGFSYDNRIARRTLTLDEAIDEAGGLACQGFRHLLLVSGESNRHLPVARVAEVARALAPRFASIAVEIQPLEEDGYRELAAAGVDGVVVYQETYDPDVYAAVHTKGPKTRFSWRLDAVERAGAAGLRSLGIGALLGLGDWRLEAIATALHARHLARSSWRSRVGISFPRIRAAAGGYVPAAPVGDRDLVQMLCAMRLAMPDAELVVSTREPAALRDHLIGLGVTRMSAGSRTNPGGYTEPEASERQFDIVDERAPQEVADVIAAHGFEPVWKDFDRSFLTG